MKKPTRRSSYFEIPSGFELARSPITIWGYDQSQKIVCRLEINGAGIAVYSGPKGKKMLLNDTWERFVQDLETLQES